MDKPFREHFHENFFLRHHMAVLLLATGFAGMLIDRLLLKMGVRYLCLRYTLSVTFAYVVFVVLVRIWLAYVKSQFEPLAEYPEPPKPKPAGEVDVPIATSRTFWDWLLAPLEMLEFGEGCGWFLLILVCLAAIVGLFASAIFLIWDSPAILADAAFEFFLAAGMIRPLKKLDRPDWTSSILATTWKPFAGVLTFTIIFGMIAEFYVPGATTMKDVLRACGF